MKDAVNESMQVDSIQEVLVSLMSVVNGTECAAMPEDVLSEYRKTLSKVQGTAKDGLSKTSRKELNFDEKEIIQYIDWVLQRGYELIETNPNDVPRLNDAQTIKRYRKFIKERVQVSSFGEDKFKIVALSVQRKSIENSANLHQLRQNIKAMIPVLKLYHEYIALRGCYDEIMAYTTTWIPAQDHDAVLLELEAEQKLSAERKRVIDEMIDGLYLPASEMTDEELLKAVDDFKVKHQCSDEEAAKVFSTNRTKITRLRRYYKLN